MVQFMKQVKNGLGLERKRDYQVGDVITVILDESTQAQRTQELDVSRQSENDVMTNGMANAFRPKIGGSLFRDFSFDGNTIESTGEGDAAQVQHSMDQLQQLLYKNYQMET